jgi:hypothetical protein
LSRDARKASLQSALFIITVFSFGALVTLLPSPVAAQPKGEPIKIGWIAELSGTWSFFGAIGAGLTSNPELCMFDEPSMGLAPIVIGEITQTLYSLRKTGLTVLLAEQNATLASEVADRIYILGVQITVRFPSRMEGLRVSTFPSSS